MSLFIQTIPGLDGFLKAGDAISAWPFWVVILFVLILILYIGYQVYKGNQKAQADITAILARQQQGGNEVTAANAAVLAQMATLLTAYQKKDVERDKADADRDKALAMMAEGLTKQNEILSDIKHFQETGNSYTQTLHNAIVSSVGDTSAAVGAVGQSLTAQIEVMQAKLIELLGALPEIYAQKTINSHSAMRTSVQELSKDITRVFAPVISENVKLNETVRFLNSEIANRDAQITLMTKQLQTEHPAIPEVPKDGEQ